MNLDLESLIESIRRQGAVPVRLASDPSLDDESFWSFEGTTDEFITAAVALGAKGIYFKKYDLTEDDFFFEPESEDEVDDDSELDVDRDDDDDEDGHSSTTASAEDIGDALRVDLRELEPGLRKFERYIGKTWCLALSATTPESNLHLTVYADWYDALETMKEPFVERLESSTEELRAAREAAHAKRQEEERAVRLREREEARSGVLAELDGLLEQAEFCNLSTKGAMTAFVEERVPRAATVLGPDEFRKQMTRVHQKALLLRGKRR